MTRALVDQLQAASSVQRPRTWKPYLMEMCPAARLIKRRGTNSGETFLAPCTLSGNCVKAQIRRLHVLQMRRMSNRHRQKLLFQSPDTHPLHVQQKHAAARVLPQKPTVDSSRAGSSGCQSASSKASEVAASACCMKRAARRCSWWPL